MLCCKWRECRKLRHPGMACRYCGRISSRWMTAGDIRLEPRGLLGQSGGLVDPADVASSSAAMANLGPWSIVRTLGRDLCGVYYVGRRDDGERATLYVLSAERVA